MTKDEALQTALNALERGEDQLRWEAIAAVKEALALPPHDEFEEGWAAAMEHSHDMLMIGVET